MKIKQRQGESVEAARLRGQRVMAALDEKSGGRSGDDEATMEDAAWGEALERAALEKLAEDPNFDEASVSAWLDGKLREYRAAVDAAADAEDHVEECAELAWAAKRKA